MRIAEQYQLLPALTAEEYDALKADIRARGVQVPIELDEHGAVLDGHHRVRAWHELRAEGEKLDEYPSIVRVGLSEEEKRAHVRALNLHRRHLNQEQKREVIGAQLVETPTRSDRQIAQDLGVSQPTVSTVRHDLESSGDVKKVITSTDTLGRRQPRHRQTSAFASTRRAAARLVKAVAAQVELPTGWVDPKQVRLPSPQPAPRADPGPLPMTGLRLEVADATKLPLDDASVDLIVTSPPYGLDKPYDDGSDLADGWHVFMAAWLREAYRVTRPGGRLALNVPLDTTRPEPRATYMEAGRAAIQAGWSYRWTIIWNEGNITRTTARGSVDSPSAPHVISRVEMIAVFHKGAWRREPTGASDLTHAEWLDWTDGLWTFPNMGARTWEGHPAPFPEELPRRLIKLLSFQGDVVLDPFVGSGTTALVAHQLGREAIGFDRSAAYVASARRRLAEAAP